MVYASALPIAHSNKLATPHFSRKRLRIFMIQNQITILYLFVQRLYSKLEVSISRFDL